MILSAKPARISAFTLIELLVVIGVVSLLTSITIPVLGVCKNSARMVVCKENLRQLVLANEGYASDNDGYSVPGALNIDTENLHRWYGKRASKHDPFDTARGPLMPYLQGAVLNCPQNVTYEEVLPSDEIYEGDSGGYGYNFIYLGSRIWQSGYEKPDSSRSTRLGKASRPQATLAFTDTAFVHAFTGPKRFIQYGFVEPPCFIVEGQAVPTWTVSPSIHFRHRNRACVAWVDGHVDARKTAGYDGESDDGTRPADYDLGWFAPIDNSLFDLE